MAQPTCPPLACRRGGCTVPVVRRPGPALGILLLALVAAGGALGSGRPPAMPLSLERSIAKSLPVLAYFPTRIPAPWHYSDHAFNRFGRPGFDLWFSKPGEPDLLGYHVVEGLCPGYAMHTFRMNKVTVRWSATYEDQKAWRCFSKGHIAFSVLASASVPGDDNLTTARRRRDALTLVQLIAYIKRIS